MQHENAYSEKVLCVQRKQCQLLARHLDERIFQSNALKGVGVASVDGCNERSTMHSWHPEKKRRLPPPCLASKTEVHLTTEAASFPSRITVPLIQRSPQKHTSLGSRPILPKKLWMTCSTWAAALMLSMSSKVSCHWLQANFECRGWNTFVIQPWHLKSDISAKILQWFTCGAWIRKVSTDTSLTQAPQVKHNSCNDSVLADVTPGQRYHCFNQGSPQRHTFEPQQ